MEKEERYYFERLKKLKKFVCSLQKHYIQKPIIHFYQDSTTKDLNKNYDGMAYADGIDSDVLFANAFIVSGENIGQILFKCTTLTIKEKYDDVLYAHPWEYKDIVHGLVNLLINIDRAYNTDFDCTDEYIKDSFLKNSHITPHYIDMTECGIRTLISEKGNTPRYVEYLKEQCELSSGKKTILPGDVLTLMAEMVAIGIDSLTPMDPEIKDKEQCVSKVATIGKLEISE